VNDGKKRIGSLQTGCRAWENPAFIECARNWIGDVGVTTAIAAWHCCDRQRLA